jgi:SAM-dependent methyltransferase
MDAAYRAAYRRLYREHWWWRARERLLERELRRLSAGRRFGRILDVGCGDGLFFPVLERFGEPSGVEADAGLLTPDGPYRARIYAGPFDDRYQPEERFGLVLALDVVEHVTDTPAFMNRVRNLLQPGGWFVATVPALRALWTSHDTLNAHVTRYRRDEFAALVAGAGLEVEHARYCFVWLALAKLAVRAAEAVVPRAPHTPGIPPAPINKLLEGICLAEQAVLGRSRAPFGSSVLLVARAKGG